MKYKNSIYTVTSKFTKVDVDNLSTLFPIYISMILQELHQQEKNIILQ
jgi:hypothetical protein